MVGLLRGGSMPPVPVLTTSPESSAPKNPPLKNVPPKKFMPPPKAFRFHKGGLLLLHSIQYIRPCEPLQLLQFRSLPHCGDRSSPPNPESVPPHEKHRTQGSS